jgi:hypothetical protein
VVVNVSAPYSGDHGSNTGMSAGVTDMFFIIFLFFRLEIKRGVVH